MAKTKFAKPDCGSSMSFVNPKMIPKYLLKNVDDKFKYQVCDGKKNKIKKKIDSEIVLPQLPNRKFKVELFAIHGLLVVVNLGMDFLSLGKSKFDFGDCLITTN